MALTTGRMRAPELVGAGGWINTDRPLHLADLRGRAVLLDFWTFCCINCLRVIEEVRPLEERFADRLVVIGVHSPKFPHEADHEAVERAVRRHRVMHPVLDDPDMQTWQRYGVRAWPTLVLIDPDGYVVAQAAGEGSVAGLAPLIAAALDGRTAPGVPAFDIPLDRESGELSYPGKVASDGAGRIAIADTGHDRVVVCDQSGAVVHAFDGFHQPQGVRFDGELLVVCDTVAGEVLALSLPDGGRRVLARGIHSPWDAIVIDDGYLIAEAGLHRLLHVPRQGGEFTVIAGTKAEGLRDGAAGLAHLAQPSGLAALPDGVVAIADAEVSALRVLRGGRIETLVGSGLFEWGQADGDRDHARLQHPLGVAALPDSAIAVADTFNSRVAVWRDGELRTIPTADPLAEPGGLDSLPGGKLIVADTNHHRVVIVDPTTGAVEELNVRARSGLGSNGSEVQGAPGSVVRLVATLQLGEDALDQTQGPPVRVTVSAEPALLLGPGARAWAFDELPAGVEICLGGSGSGELTLDVIAATCRGDVCSIRRNTVRHPLNVHPSAQEGRRSER